METFKKYAPKVLALVLTVALVFALVKIYEFETHMDNIERNHLSKISSLYDEVGNIYSNVDEQLKKQASLFSSVEWEAVEPDVENNSVKVKFVLVPKTITDSMQVTVSVGDDTLELSRSENTFSGVMSVDMFLTQTTHPYANIKSGETVQTELLEHTNLSCLYEKFLPVFTASQTYGDTSYKPKTAIEFEYFIDSYHTEYASLEEFCIVLEKNGKEIDRQNITELVAEYREHHGDSFTSIYSFDTDISESDEYKAYAQAVDSFGYIHKSLVYTYSNNGESIEFEKFAEIYSPDGICLTDDFRVL